MKLHKKKISDLENIVCLDIDDGIDCVSREHLKQWAVAVVKELRREKNNLPPQVEIENVNERLAYAMVTAETAIVEMFLIDKFELTKEDLK